MLNRALIFAFFLGLASAGVAHAQTVPTPASSGSPDESTASTTDQSQKTPATAPKAGKGKGQAKRGASGAPRAMAG